MRRYIVVCTESEEAFDLIQNELDNAQIETALFEFNERSGAYQPVSYAIADYFQFPVRRGNRAD